MTPGERNVSVVETGIALTLLIPAVFTRECGRSVTLRVCKVPGKGVAALKLDTMAKMAVHSDVDSVIVADSTILHRLYLLERRKGRVLQRRSIADRIHWNRVPIFRQGEICSHGADTAHLQ